MKYFAKIVSPIVEILSVSTKLVLHILKISPSTEAPVTEEEIESIQQFANIGLSAPNV